MAAPQTGTSILDQFPPEIYDEIGSNLTGRELDGVTRSSKRLRALFLRSLFHTIRFDHLQPAVRDRLRRFINHQTPEKMTEIWTAVRRASFLFPFPHSISDFDLEEMLPLSQDALRFQVLQAVRLLSHVRHLTIDLERFGDRHIDTFRAAHPSAPRWEHLESLRLTGLGENRRFAAALIHNSSPNKLKAVDLSGIHSFLLSSKTVANRKVQEQSLEQMTEALRQMPCLVRFAFTLHINRFQPDTIRDRLGLDENGNEPLTDNEVWWWYTAQVQRIADAVPQFEEVCVFGNFGSSMGVDIAGIYRGTKIEDGKSMHVLVDAVQPGVECLTFPWGLDNDIYP
ncbi:uncharacterized protein NECHADRAFT_74052 [Fusarium vanettenii 77-13-4]|uniref:F-box domain-containing protein n=1 Tax=Fusarium vanettenii (strain ATCC MYA-4622 / CBS 123669 / FGSC 9596 / NRRL 45880 / 77-13-4) TaxID=660122 RepID=C7YVR7_FUSV7|nr:uncharacterized protein NECHADRAFT_74052 [Fusarium vanettenii 77-13-4]EEU43840.1 predicted protein [Fusarium vanettenii 77-13-4]